MNGAVTESMARSASPSGDDHPVAGVAVVGDVGAASAMLKPLRLELLERLVEPESATGLARALGLPRQRLNYHLRELERAGLIRCVEERPRGGFVERLYRASARHYLIGPEALGRVAPPAPGAEERGARDRFSWSYLLALLGKALRDLAVLRRRADRAGKRLATVGVETRVRFASPAAFAEFGDRVVAALSDLVAEYHDPRGRSYELVLGSYPTLTAPDRSAKPAGAAKRRRQVHRKKS